MTRRPLVAANWKMHGQRAQVDALAAAFITGLAALNRIDVLVCPAFVFLARLQAAFSETPLMLGAQDLHPDSEGAFTGEVSGGMLQEAGCSHVLVGHSERRRLFGETDQFVALKFRAAMRDGLVPVLCVGETENQRKAGQTAEVIRSQLGVVVDACGSTVFGQGVIAYEPVWAIGTGLSATPEQAQEVHALIRSELAARGCDQASSTRILYGGSVKAGNATQLFAQPDIDGALVGGASLVAEDFLAICRSANK